MAKKIKYLMLHCSATRQGKDFNTKQIMQWFIDRGWNSPGYRAITHLDGRIETLKGYNQNELIEDIEISNGAKGWNSETVHLSYIGGVDDDGKTPKDTRTSFQKDSLESQIKFYVYSYPWIKVIGHNQVSAKACPSFNVPDFCRSIGIPEINIDTQIYPSQMTTIENLFDFKH